jgi:ATP-binding cassette subfamily B protein
MTADTGNKITVFISHRLSSATLADNIFLIEGGRVTECGNHARLMAKGGRYKEIFTVQAKNYK